MEDLRNRLEQLLADLRNDSLSLDEVEQIIIDALEILDGIED